MTFPDEFLAISKIEKNDTEVLRENVSKILREGIYSGYLLPGYRLTESQLASTFKLSRTPVREAILQLESEGLVKILPHKGAVVTYYSVDELDEIYIIYGSLAGVAASLSVDTISKDGLKQMEVCLEKMEVSIYGKDRREWFIQNNEYHKAFLKPCRKKLLLKLIENYSNQVGRYWYLMLSPAGNMELFSRQHREILEAFKSKNPEVAKRTVENHVRSFGKIVVEILKSIAPIRLG